MKKLSHDEIEKKRLKLEMADGAARVPIVVLVDSVRSLYNVGSIFRTSDGAMIQKLLLTGYTPHPPRKEIEKTALGATKSVPWEYIRNPLEAIASLKRSGFRIYSLELTDRSIPYTDVPYDAFPLCLIIGNEITGVSQTILHECDGAIDIPMFGTKQSLNVAVAYGIALFELARIWRTTSGQTSNASV
jgi:tRNA G18 (ribose-2'-O)-methylase SpoU